MPFVLPEHYFYPLDPGAPDLQRPLGYLCCRVLEAKHIPRMDLFGWSDTFVEVFVRHTQRNRTQVCPGKAPEWDEEFVLPVHSVAHQKLRFALWDYDAFSPDDEIGRCEVALADLEERKTHDLWLDVVNEGEEEQAAAKAKRSEQRWGQFCSRDRFLRGAVKPAGSAAHKPSLHVSVMWRPWTPQETAFVKEAVKQGVRRALGTPEAAGVDPELKKLLMSGTLLVTVKKCSRLDVHGLLWRPSV